MPDSYFDQQFYRDCDELHRLMGRYHLQTFLRTASIDQLTFAADQFRSMTRTLGEDIVGGLASGFKEGVVLDFPIGSEVVEGTAETMREVRKAAERLSVAFAVTYTWTDDFTEEDFEKLAKKIEDGQGVRVMAPGGHNWTIRNMTIPERFTAWLIGLAGRHAGMRAYGLALRLHNHVSNWYEDRTDFTEIEVP